VRKSLAETSSSSYESCLKYRIVDQSASLALVQHNITATTQFRFSEPYQLPGPCRIKMRGVLRVMRNGLK